MVGCSPGFSDSFPPEHSVRGLNGSSAWIPSYIWELGNPKFSSEKLEYAKELLKCISGNDYKKYATSNVQIAY